MIGPMSIEVVFTAESTATGGGRDGHVKSTTGRIDLDTRPPKEMGGNGEGTNPEELFSAGYSACFLGALRLVAIDRTAAVLGLRAGLDWQHSDRVTVGLALGAQLGGGYRAVDGQLNARWVY